MNKNSQTGFTIIELLVVIVVFAIGATIAIPSYQSLIRSNRMTVQVNELVADIHYARSEAIKRGRSVSICRTNPGSNACKTNKNWGVNGWIIIADSEVIKVHESSLNSDATLFETGTTNANKGILTFNRYGYAPSGARTFRLCSSSDEKADLKGVVVTPSGRVRLAVDTDGDGAVEDGNANNLACG